MAQAGKKRAKSKKAQKKGPLLSPQTRNALIVGAAAVVVLVGGWWAYMKLTTIPPPALATTLPEKVAAYLGDERGFTRLSIPRREEFLVEVAQRLDNNEERLAFNRAVRQMTRQEQETLLDATFEVFQTRVMDMAEKYNRQPTQRAKTAFARQAIQNFRQMQNRLSGHGNPDMSVGRPFEKFVPQSSEQWQRMLVTRTTPSERAKAQPLIEEFMKIEREPTGAAN